MAQENIRLVKTDGSGEPEIRIGRIKRFLYWTTLMKNSSQSADGDRINWGFVFILALLAGFVVVAFLTLLGIGLFFYADMKMDRNNQLENWRGDHAWQDKYIYDERTKFEKFCQENAKRLKAHIALEQKNGVTVPAELLLIDECYAGNPNANKPQTGEH